MNDRERLCKAVEALEAEGVSRSWMSHELFGDGKTLQRLLIGGGKVQTLEAALSEMPKLRKSARVKLAVPKPPRSPSNPRRVASNSGK